LTFPFEIRDYYGGAVLPPNETEPRIVMRIPNEVEERAVGETPEIGFALEQGYWATMGRWSNWNGSAVSKVKYE